MKDKTILLAVFLMASMLAMVILPARAFEYYDTTLANPQDDLIHEGFGPRADKIAIRMYTTESAEFADLETGKIDMTDWPVDQAHYVPWTTDPLQQNVAVVNTGPSFALYLLDMRLDNRSNIAYPVTTPAVANPAYNTQNGNPMANLALRRAIACICDHKYTAETIISGGPGNVPLVEALYTPLASAYGSWAHPELTPTGALKEWTYSKTDGTADVARANAYLDAAGYVYDAGLNARKDPTGYKFTVEFMYRSDHSYRNDFATLVVQPAMEAAPPIGLGMKNNLVMKTGTSGAAKAYIMDTKAGHMYTGGWGEIPEPSQLYIQYHTNAYFHPGRGTNYMWYPGDGDRYTVTTANWHYTGFPDVYGWTGSGLDFSDPDKDWQPGDVVWKNPGNYWSWEMMIATGEARAQHAARKDQEFLAFYVVGVPMWADSAYTAFHRTYTGTGTGETNYTNQPWEGVVDQAGLGVWGTFSFMNMHPSGYEWGNGNDMTIRWGFRQPTLSLNPIWAEWVWDYYVLNEEMDTMTFVDPYTLSADQILSTSAEVGTWDSGDLGLGICSKATFHMRHDLMWSDGVPCTSSDIKFSWGGPLMTGSLANLCRKYGLPQPFWGTPNQNHLSITTPDPWTVVVYFDIYSYFALQSFSGWLYVIPEHVWKPLFESPPPGFRVTQPYDVPAVYTSQWLTDSTADPGAGGTITLSKNPLHHQLLPASSPQKPWPMWVWTDETSDAREQYGNTHYIYPKSGDTGVGQLDVAVSIQNRLLAGTGPGKAQHYPDTRMNVTKAVTLWKYDPDLGYDIFNYTHGYTQIAGPFVKTNYPCLRYVTATETYTFNDLDAGWYYTKVEVTTTSVEYNAGAGYVEMVGSPWVGLTKVYREYAIITSRYDIGGALWKAPYQSISDLNVDIRDLYACAKAYGTVPGYASWNSACDVNNDFKVDILDYYAIARNFGWSP